METFTVQQLKEELKRRHLPTSGNKQLLQSRLEEAMDAELEGQAVTTPKVVADSTSMDTPTPL